MRTGGRRNGQGLQGPLPVWLALRGLPHDSSSQPRTPAPLLPHTSGVLGHQDGIPVPRSAFRASLVLRVCSAWGPAVVPFSPTPPWHPVLTLPTWCCGSQGWAPSSCGPLGPGVKEAGAALESSDSAHHALSCHDFHQPDADILSLQAGEATHLTQGMGPWTGDSQGWVRTPCLHQPQRSPSRRPSTPSALQLLLPGENTPRLLTCDATQGSGAHPALSRSCSQ